VGPLAFFPGLPWPLRTILGWRCAGLQAAAERVGNRLPRVAVERFSTPFVPDLFACDGFHPNGRAHALWGEEIAALALPLLKYGAHRSCDAPLPGARRRGAIRAGVRSGSAQDPDSDQDQTPPLAVQLGLAHE
jgi:hypothetical protein